MGAEKAQEPRKVFEGILYVLRTGCQWKALPKSDYGSASAVHKYFLEWQAAGVFEQLWRASLLEYDELEGIAWEWQSLDGALVKAPLALESVGRNPTDRGKNGSKRSLLTDEKGLPAKRRAKLSRVLGKRALKSFHPRLFNNRLFAGETWSDNNGCNCRNQTATFC